MTDFVKLILVLEVPGQPLAVLLLFGTNPPLQESLLLQKPVSNR